MKKVLDINLHRKIKKKKQIRKYFFIFFMFISFFVVMFVVWQVSLKRFILKDRGENFPIFFSGDSVLGFEKIKNGFCVLTDNYFNFYRKDGSILKNIANSSPKTQIVGGRGEILFYEKGGKNFTIYNDQKEIFSDFLENSIKFGNFFKNSFAFVTDSEEYLCELVVFNDRNEQIFKWSSAESLIIDFDISRDLNKCVVAALGIKDGMSRSFVYELDFRDSKQKIKKEFLGKIPFKIKKFGSISIFVCDSVVYFLDSNLNVLEFFDYGKTLTNFELADGGYFIGCLKNIENDNFSEILVSYDKFGKKINQYKTNEKVRKIKSFGSDIFILTDEGILHTSANLKNLKQIKNFGSVEDMIYDKPYLYFVSMNKLSRFLLK